MAREIERRFLVHDTSFLCGRSGQRIVQGYLAKESGAMSARVRIIDRAAYLTLKSPRNGCERDEFEYRIPLDDAEQMLIDHCANRFVDKTRYIIEHHRQTFEVDVFHGRHAGLVIAEVELRHPNELVSLPNWVGAEITNASGYGNYSLALFEGPLQPCNYAGELLRKVLGCKSAILARV